MFFDFQLGFGKLRKISAMQFKLKLQPASCLFLQMNIYTCMYSYISFWSINWYLNLMKTSLKFWDPNDKLLNIFTKWLHWCVKTWRFVLLSSLKKLGVKLWLFSYPSCGLNFCFGCSKEASHEKALLSTHNICFGWEITNQFLIYSRLYMYPYPVWKIRFTTWFRLIRLEIWWAMSHWNLNTCIEKNRSYVYESTYITEFIKQVKEKRSNVRLKALLHYNVLANIKLCRCMKKISTMLAYAEIELKNQRKPLSEHA